MTETVIKSWAEDWKLSESLVRADRLLKRFSVVQRPTFVHWSPIEKLFVHFCVDWGQHNADRDFFFLFPFLFPIFKSFSQEAIHSFVSLSFKKYFTANACHYLGSFHSAVVISGAQPSPPKVLVRIISCWKHCAILESGAANEIMFRLKRKISASLSKDRLNAGRFLLYIFLIVEYLSLILIQ